MDQELKLCGEYGLRCKREIWRVQYALAKIRKVRTPREHLFGDLSSFRSKLTGLGLQRAPDAH